MKMTLETAFTMEMSNIKYGPGVTREIGQDLKSYGVKRLMVVTDENLVDKEPVLVALESLKKANIEAVVFDKVRVEPTDQSFNEAIQFASNGNFDGYLGIGGGSSLDTAKAANLYATYPADLLTYVNPPIGKGQPIPGPLKPLFAIPTTAGTGSETTGVAIFDYLAMAAKTGIAHRALRPLMGIIDPNNTRSMPKMVTTCTALDQVTHALESITALPYNQRVAPDSPGNRPAYQGANPISTIWAKQSLSMLTQNILTVMDNPDADAERGNVMLAATFAGIGFGNAGVHLAHGMSYPVSGMVRDYIPEGYPPNTPIVPHGMSVILNAPAVFRYTAPTNPALHIECAALMGADISNVSVENAGEILVDTIIDLMKKTGMPNGLSAVGYTETDIDKMVEGTLPQHRVTKLSPNPVDAESLKQLFKDSMVIW
jgi:hydroxyacid-oxoacid transhydrogenase